MLVWSAVVASHPFALNLLFSRAFPFHLWKICMYPDSCPLFGNGLVLLQPLDIVAISPICITDCTAMLRHDS